MRHGEALRNHILEDIGRKVSGRVPRGKEWDSIRSKDVWALAYHNDFCSRHKHMIAELISLSGMTTAGWLYSSWTRKDDRRDTTRN